jgi:hypothetical protein
MMAFLKMPSIKFFHDAIMMPSSHHHDAFIMLSKIYFFYKKSKMPS